MAYIAFFRIEGLAGRSEPVAFHLDPHVNAFFGLNGAGKTTLLRLLHSALSNDPSLLTDTYFSKAEVHVHDPTTSATAKLKIARQEIEIPSAARRNHLVYQRLRDQGFYPQLLFGSGWNMTPKTKGSSPSPYPHVYLPTSRLLLFQGPRMRETDTEAAIAEGFEHTLRSQWASFYGSLQNEARKVHEKGLAEILQEVLVKASDLHASSPSQAPSKALFDKVRAFVKRNGISTAHISPEDFAKQYMTSPLLKNVVDHIVNVEELIEKIMSPKSRLAELLRKLFKDRKFFNLDSVDIQVRNSHGKTLSLKHLSSGEKHVLLILIETLRAAHSPLLVDEPELSMHVDWQGDLVASMRTLNPHAQIILATHSPEVLAGVPDDKVFAI